MQLLPARSPEEEEGDPSGAVCAGGFSSHAGAAIAPHQRGLLERWTAPDRKVVFDVMIDTRWLRLYIRPVLQTEVRGP